MRDTYDCAVVLIPGHGPWLQQWLRRHQGQSLRAGHPRLFPQLPECAGQQASTVWLRASALSLRRFDACLLPVEAATLSWVRTALSVARQELSTPVLALVEGVGAIAVRDLLRLGLEDFLRPECPDELRLRVALAASRRQRQTGRRQQSCPRRPPRRRWTPPCWTPLSARPRRGWWGTSSAPICTAAWRAMRAMSPRRRARRPSIGAPSGP